MSHSLAFPLGLPAMGVDTWSSVSLIVSPYTPLTAPLTAIIELSQFGRQALKEKNSGLFPTETLWAYKNRKTTKHKYTITHIL